MPLSFNPKVITEIPPQGGFYKVFLIDDVLSQSISFALDEIAANPSQSKVFLNGLKQRHGSDYSIDGSVLNWFGQLIKPNWFLEVYY